MKLTTAGRVFHLQKYKLCTAVPKKGKICHSSQPLAHCVFRPEWTFQEIWIMFGLIICLNMKRHIFTVLPFYDSYSNFSIQYWSGIIFVQDHFLLIKLNIYWLFDVLIIPFVELQKLIQMIFNNFQNYNLLLKENNFNEFCNIYFGDSWEYKLFFLFFPDISLVRLFFRFYYFSIYLMF